ncbi:hypothetical protein [Nonomuraea basaltis]|uniref:hypothetical protein n=1 Tax=Nonomuraea basaltis TaxID=2495887 RepID=UPI001486426A|nr:hypothetical protein [Nonomuraea basaltis]
MLQEGGFAGREVQDGVAGFLPATTTAQLDGGDDGGEVVVQQHQVGGFTGHVGA